jgi:acetylornithine/succinyldiaminopimelate/putrescine aminotransferase
VAVTYEPKYREPFFLDEQDWVHFVDFNDAKAVDKLFADGKAKSVIFEYVQGEEGACLPADEDFVKELREVCDKHGALMVADEIQTGFGRTAKKEGDWFACMTYGVIPDIMTIGKSFGGGYPVTAVVAKPEISESMKPGYDGSTFGGNPMAMVAAMIATRQMRERNVTGNVIERSKQIFDGLANLKKKHSIMGEIRGLGLMIAFELQTPKQVGAFQEAMAERGVKTSLATQHWVRFLPPLIITESDTVHLLSAIDGSLAQLS